MISPIDRDALKKLDMPIVLLVKDDGAALERVAVGTLASLLPSARITSLPRESDEQRASGSEWTEAIVEVLLGR
jgi:hypothetical protein